MDIVPGTKTKLDSNYFTHSVSSEIRNGEVSGGRLWMYLKAVTIKASDVDFFIGDFDVLPNISKSTSYTIVCYMDLTKIPKEQHLRLPSNVINLLHRGCEFCIDFDFDIIRHRRERAVTIKVSTSPIYDLYVNPECKTEAKELPPIFLNNTVTTLSVVPKNNNLFRRAIVKEIK